MNFSITIVLLLKINQWNYHKKALPTLELISYDHHNFVLVTIISYFVLFVQQFDLVNDHLTSSLHNHVKYSPRSRHHH